MLRSKVRENSVRKSVEIRMRESLGADFDETCSKSLTFSCVEKNSSSDT